MYRQSNKYKLCTVQHSFSYVHVDFVHVHLLLEHSICVFAVTEDRHACNTDRFEQSRVISTLYMYL